MVGQGPAPVAERVVRIASRIARDVDGWNRDILPAAQRQQPTSARRASWDGTVVEANASRYRLLNSEQKDLKPDFL